MAKPLPLTDADGEVRELTEDDFKHFKSFSSLPDELQAVLRGRGKQKAPTKVSTTVRFSPEVLAYFRSTGKGWQKRMDDALKEWLKEHTA
ncbi:hypothetical protein VZ94_09250 [Methylocucumis oryzae]|uniref:BrnA antitoxin family protein n=2 Tax=Methylocucumis oryzae TaxID=1632867 RepID=A0A0F3IJ24_9GAMM|nr:hypothetical protein VZ94_09250 [Methylocucumis oryzae]